MLYFLPDASNINFDAAQPETLPISFEGDQLESPTPDFDSQPEFFCEDYNVPIKEEEVIHEDISRYHAGRSAFCGLP